MNPRTPKNNMTSHFQKWRMQRFENQTNLPAKIVKKGSNKDTIEFKNWKNIQNKKWFLSDFNYLIGDPIKYVDLSLRKKEIKAVLIGKSSQEDGILIRLKIRNPKEKLIREKIIANPKYIFFGTPQSKKWYIDLYLKNAQNLGIFLSKPKYQYDSAHKRCQALDDSGYRCFKIQHKDEICKSHYLRKIELIEYEQKLWQDKLRIPSHSLKLPKFLEPYTEEKYPPNEIIEIKRRKPEINYRN